MLVSGFKYKSETISVSLCVNETIAPFSKFPVNPVSTGIASIKFLNSLIKFVTVSLEVAALTFSTYSSIKSRTFSSLFLR